MLKAFYYQNQCILVLLANSLFDVFFNHCSTVFFQNCLNKIYVYQCWLLIKMLSRRPPGNSSPRSPQVEAQNEQKCWKSTQSRNLTNFELRKPKSFTFGCRCDPGPPAAPCLATLDRQNASVRPHSDARNEQIRNSIATKLCRGDLQWAT